MKKQPLVSIFQEAREDEQIIDAFSERLQMDEPAENEEKAIGVFSLLLLLILLLYLCLLLLYISLPLYLRSRPSGRI